MPPTRHRLPFSFSPTLLGWIAVIASVWLPFSAPWGDVAADTKHDLVANPGGFLAGALHAYTDNFTLGQLQNQAYGYLFPQGPFFLATDFLPDWVAQRLWWTIVLSIGYTGMVELARRVLPTATSRLIALGAIAYSLSPRVLSTLTAISSETWPIMLAPWVIVPLLTRQLSWRRIAAAILPVALMGAVNATATTAACLPAALVLVWRRGFFSRGGWKWAIAWLSGCALVSAWWIGPLVILGRFAPPFTEFIESSFVTTRWLNLAEILRGTTSWAPFVENERAAGTALATEPVFVLLTMAVAAAGLAGLAGCASARRTLHSVWRIMLLVGIVILGMHAAWYLHALDGPLAAFRNLHKFDPLVRIPLSLGVVALGMRLSQKRGSGASAPEPSKSNRAAAPSPDRGASRWLHPTPRQAAGAVLTIVVCLSTAPAFNGQLLPRGTYQEVPSYWQDAADFLNSEAAGTRTLIYPPASFARQQWGWTRDEPAQALLDVPWAVRDSIPLVPPEAIRGLDGVTAALEHDPQAGARALKRLGIGAVLLRHDLDESVTPQPARAERASDDENGKKHDDGVLDAEDLPGTVHRFGPHDEVEVVVLDGAAAMTIGPADPGPVRVAGGGESLALMDMLAAGQEPQSGSGPGPDPGATAPPARELVDRDADIVTDTPLLVDRNYGTLRGPVSSPLSKDDPSTADNRLRDYPSAGPRVAVEEHGGSVRASSSAADADSFGGADPARSTTAAVDGDADTAWWPAPGEKESWIELRGRFEGASKLVLRAADDAEVTVRSGDAKVEVTLEGGKDTTVTVPGGPTDAIRVEPHERVGIAEMHVDGHPIERVVTVPDTSPDVKQFLFQRLVVDTGNIIRDFTAPREMRVVADADAGEKVFIDGKAVQPGSATTLSPGKHRVESNARWVTLTEEGWDPGAHSELVRAAGSAGPAGSTAPPVDIAPADTDRLLITGRAFNKGLRGQLDGKPLEPREVDAATQAFIIPAGASGRFTMSFAADRQYRGWLLGGGALMIAVAAACVFLGRWGVAGEQLPAEPLTAEPLPGLRAGGFYWAGALLTLGALAAVSWQAAVAGVVGIIAKRWVRPEILAPTLCGIAGAIVARAPWPSADYAGDSWLIAALCGAAIAVAVAPRE